MEINFELYSMKWCRGCDDLRKDLISILNEIGIKKYNIKIKMLTSEQAEAIDGVPQLFLNETRLFPPGYPGKERTKIHIAAGLKALYMAENRNKN